MTDETDVTGLIERLRARRARVPDPNNPFGQLVGSDKLSLEAADAIESLQTDVHNAREAALANKSVAEEARAALEASQREAGARVQEAVMAERERIADWYEDKGWRLDEGHIADAIRSQETGDTR